MINVQVKAYFTGEETRKIKETQKGWAPKLATIAHMSRPYCQVLIHDMPLTHDPENPEQIMELQKTNTLFIKGITIQNTAWLKRSRTPNKTSGLLIVLFDGAEQVSIAISKGVMWKSNIKATKIFRSGFRLVQCFNCQKYGHISKIYTAEPKYGYCVKPNMPCKTGSKVQSGKE